MKTISLITLLAESFNCSRSALQDKINHPLASNKLLEILSGKRLQTNYFDRNGKKKEVKCARLSILPASTLPVYEGFLNGKHHIFSLLYSS